MQSLRAYIEARGVTTALNGWTLSRATGISNDGKVIVGKGLNPQGQAAGWIVVLE